MSDEFYYIVTIRVGTDERNWRVTDARNRYAAVMPCVAAVIKEFKLPGRPYQYWASATKRYGFEGIMEIQVMASTDGRRLAEESRIGTAESVNQP